MELFETLGAELVTLWMERSVGSQESFGYLISDFLQKHPDIISREDVAAVLQAARIKAAEAISGHGQDKAMNLSYKAFSSALDHFINAV